ncbi:hypothetical protein V6N13_109540 [Hibiscus sabdariffa]|uniref:DUF4283 domain-containing protein n=1 Tax=Hibiscus sabdariffa TaxID=183260 RepID=A0ABR2FQL3_9ROSI
MHDIKFIEEENIVLDNVGEEPESTEGSEKWIAGTIINTKPIDTDSILRVFQKVFAESKLEEMVVLNKNFFLTKFYKQEGNKNILNKCPWIFDGDLLAVREYKPEFSIDEYNFDKFQIWVIVFGIPLGMMSKQLGGSTRSMMGAFVAIDMREGEGRWGEFLRIQVELD